MKVAICACAVLVHNKIQCSGQQNLRKHTFLQSSECCRFFFHAFSNGLPASKFLLLIFLADSATDFHYVCHYYYRII